MGRWTIKLLKRCPPDQRLLIAARLFWISIALGVFCSLVIAQGWYEGILMGISWGAITITCVDVIVGTDIRDEQG